MLSAPRARRFDGVVAEVRHLDIVNRAPLSVVADPEHAEAIPLAPTVAAPVAEVGTGDEPAEAVVGDDMKQRGADVVADGLDAVGLGQESSTMRVFITCAVTAPPARGTGAGQSRLNEVAFKLDSSPSSGRGTHEATYGLV